VAFGLGGVAELLVDGVAAVVGDLPAVSLVAGGALRLLPGQFISKLFFLLRFENCNHRPNKR